MVPTFLKILEARSHSIETIPRASMKFCSLSEQSRCRADRTSEALQRYFEGSASLSTEGTMAEKAYHCL
jgi:hypothetical protein